ncbi:uncharacterized protein YecE (DUF72 family) [Mucilaginibacter frigoritolerans]|jgi:uncharacterized protein YecE (DUF72 family)|uniref:Uncharacterized protein YecE (DUF72 family) n=1 Tax=Mucilaginibacter frigoritolerans TaxID=652788 RepID=A0A562UHF2_9SPHI|nr:DUF72 domain-containing protein [Mucilaginibacter frigoritolerans]TWJ04511.1 uncharacterized protein YecE (DUF72 family) [Mucilaginibacter frigoritolerans]
MEFGRVNPEELATADFTLPPDTALTIKTLQESKNDNPLQVHVGCAKWGRKEWVGQIYPPKTKDANFLDEYVKHFDCIELNATFYNIYSAEIIAKWRDKAEKNPEFKFCPKFSQMISHIRRLKNAEELTTQYYKGIMAFGDKLGPLFLQLGDNYTPKSFEDVKAYLEHLPKDVPVFLEIRHKEWFSVKENSDQIFNLLHQLNIGAVITDATGRRDVVHMNLPTPHAFIRFVGNGLHPTDYARVDEWVERIAQWKELGLQSVWFFMHQHDEQYSPKLADYVVEQLNQKLGLSLRRPFFLSKNELF